MTFPVVGGRITQGFKPDHLGIDIAPRVPGDPTTPCLSPQAGTVVEASSGKIEGNYVIVESSDRFYYFGHLSKRMVAVGQKLIEGQPLGILGQTGQATGIHTHHWVRKTRYGGYINPEELYKQEEGEPMPNRKEIKAFFNKHLKHNPTERQYKLYESRPWSEMANNVAGTLRNSLESESAKVTKAGKRIKELEKQLGNPVTLQKGVTYIVEE